MLVVVLLDLLATSLLFLYLSLSPLIASTRLGRPVSTPQTSFSLYLVDHVDSPLLTLQPNVPCRMGLVRVCPYDRKIWTRGVE